MIYLINNKRLQEHYFWDCLHCIATESQIKRVLDGDKVLIDGTLYEMKPDEEFIIEEGEC